MKTSYAANPNLLIVQSRLFAPAYWGPGRWMIVEPRSRKTYLAKGTDTVPKVIRILNQGASPRSGRELEKLAGSALPELLRCGLLTESREEMPRSLVDLYHLLVTDYPTEDYYRSDWGERDAKRMKAYASEEAPPSRATFRRGSRVMLPSVQAHGIGTTTTDEVHQLAALLHVTFAPIGEVQWALGKMFRKTNPSGGARHPTEPIVLIPKRSQAFKPGSYYYDCESHALVRAARYDSYCDALGVHEPFGILLGSRVQRAMWRYRDLWALRPTLIDAGHVITTLLLVSSWMNLRCVVDQPPSPQPRAWYWLKEPPMFLLHFGDGISPQPLRPELPLSALDRRRSYLTHPLIVLRPGKDGLMALTPFPKDAMSKVNERTFRILNHCLPSRRGDRVTTLAGCLKQLRTVRQRDFEELVEHGFLLPKEDALNAYREVGLWSRYGWYISLLVHASSYTEPMRSSWQTSVTDLRNTYGDRRLKDALYTRRTSRVFGTDLIQKSVIERLLRTILASDATLQGFAFMTRVEGAAAGLCRWLDDHLEYLPSMMTNADIRATTIGQSAACAGAATIWLTVTSDDTAAGYEQAIARLGAAGQQLCLAATAEGLSVFLTPAVFEGRLFPLLGLTGSRRIIYVFAIGRRADAKS